VIDFTLYLTICHLGHMTCQDESSKVRGMGTYLYKKGYRQERLDLHTAIKAVFYTRRCNTIFFIFYLLCSITSQLEDYYNNISVQVNHIKLV